MRDRVFTNTERVADEIRSYRLRAVFTGPPSCILAD
jgi:hypothetical protein